MRTQPDASYHTVNTQEQKMQRLALLVNVFPPGIPGLELGAVYFACLVFGKVLDVDHEKAPRQ